MPGRSIARQEQLRDTGWHGAGPECQDIAAYLLRSPLFIHGEGEDTGLPTPGSYSLPALPTPAFFPLTPAGTTGQVWAAQTEEAT